MIHEIGPHKIMHGDVLRYSEEFLEMVGPAVDVVYTDPPWDERVLTGFYEASGVDKWLDFELFLCRLVALYEALCPDGLIILEFGYRAFDKHLLPILEASGAKTLGSFVTSYGLKKKPIDCRLWFGTFGNVDFISVFPPKLHGREQVEWVVDTFIQPGMRVVDPCCGVGMQLLAAQKVCAIVYGAEINGKKVDKLVKRLNCRLR